MANKQIEMRKVKKLTIVDEYTEEIKELEVFVCVLSSSQFTYLKTCESQKKEDFILFIKVYLS